MIRALVLLVVAVLTAAGCASSEPSPDAAVGAVGESAGASALVVEDPTAPPAEPSATPAPSPTPTLGPTPSPSATAPPAATSTPEPAPAPTSTATPEPVPTPTPSPSPCTVIDDFDTVFTGWQVVLDGVMGGLSNGQAVIEDGEMRVTGTINTNGGGFVMVRRPIDPIDFDGAATVRIVARADERTYEVIADDALPGRLRSVAHFAPLAFEGDGVTQIGTVAFDDLRARSFGTPVVDAPFRPDLAVSLGVILSDGVDGQFEIVLERIEACP